MVQQGGSDSLRIDIAIQTRANLQAIEETAERLQRLSAGSIQARNTLGQFTSQIEAKMTPALQKSGAALADILQTGFSPKFIGSIQGVNSALANAGKTFQSYTNEALKSGAISQATATNFNQLSQGMIATGVTGKATIATLQELSNQLAQLQPRTEAGRAGVQALSAELEILRIQFVEAGNAAEQRLNRPLTSTQRAGQGLLLSFSLTQLASGRLSQAMFGLGFAVLFTGFKFLNLITISVALSAALGSILLDKLTSALGSSASASERASERFQELRTAIDEVKGEAALFERELAGLIGELDNLGLILAGVVQQETAAGGLKGILTGVGKAFSGLAVDIAASVDVVGIGFRGLQGGFERLGEEEEVLDAVLRDGLVTMEEFSVLLNLNTQNADALKSRLGEVTNASDQFADSLRKEAMEALVQISIQFSRQAELQKRLKPFEIDIEATREQFGIQIEEQRRALQIQLEGMQDALQDQVTARREALREETDLIRAEAENQIQARRDALELELEAIRESQNKEIGVIRDNLQRETDAIRNELDNRITVIRDKSAEAIAVIRKGLQSQIDVVREEGEEITRGIRRALEDQIDAIRKQTNDRIKAIREAAELEIDANKEKIDVLQDQERELERTLSNLRSRRIDIISERVRAEAELAAMERQAQQLGVGFTEEQAILKARIEGLNKQQKATEDEIEEREKSLDTIQGQIEIIEDLIDKIIEARDKAIEAAREEQKVRERAARDAADEEIREVRRATNEKIAAFRDAANEAIAEARKAAAEAIKAARGEAKTAIQLAQDVANTRISELQKTTRVAEREARGRADADIRATQDAAAVAINEATKRANVEIAQATRSAREQRRLARDTANFIIGEIGRERRARIGEIQIARDQARADIARGNAIRDRVLPNLAKEIQLRFQSLFLQIQSTESLRERQRLQRNFIDIANDAIRLLESLGLGPEAVALRNEIISAILNFQGGGIVPGPVGRPQLALVHGGEKITEPGKQLPSGQVGDIIIHIEHMDVNRPEDIHKLTRAINQRLGRSARTNTKSRRFGIR